MEETARNETRGYSHALKIGYFITQFPYPESFKKGELYQSYPTGGAEVAAYHLARNFARMGHEVTVFTTSADSRSSLEESGGVKIYRYATNLKIMKGFISLQLFLKSPQITVDIVHIHFANPPAELAAWLYAKIKRKPLVVHYHGDTGTYGRLIRNILLSLWNRFVLNIVLSSAKIIICNSEYYISQSHYLPKYREKIVAIPCGINPEEIQVSYNKEECREKLSLQKGDKIILFVGVLINYKSPNLLIEALPLIIEEIPEAKLVLVGDGPMRHALEKLSQELGVSDKVIFAGRVGDDSKTLYYNAADVFALPSTMSSESFGIVLLEAAVARLPLVVSSLNAFRALVKDGYNGLVTELGDAVSLAEAINRLLADPALRQEMGENARVSVKDYSWENIAKRVESVYKTLVT